MVYKLNRSKAVRVDSLIVKSLGGWHCNYYTGISVKNRHHGAGQNEPCFSQLSSEIMSLHV